MGGLLYVWGMGQGKSKSQKIHFKAIVGNVGLLLHVPAIMAFLSLIIATIFGEMYAFLPFLITGMIGVGVGQLLFRLYFHPEVIRLFDAMITAALGFLFCSMLAVLPMEEGHSVYVVNSTEAKRREVEFDIIKDDCVRIKSGIRPGDKLIIEGHRFVAPGQKVNIIESK